MEQILSLLSVFRPSTSDFGFVLALALRFLFTFPSYCLYLMTPLGGRIGYWTTMVRQSWERTVVFRSLAAISFKLRIRLHPRFTHVNS